MVLVEPGEIDDFYVIDPENGVEVCSSELVCELALQLSDYIFELQCKEQAVRVIIPSDTVINCRINGRVTCTMSMSQEDKREFWSVFSQVHQKKVKEDVQEKIRDVIQGH